MEEEADEEEEESRTVVVEDAAAISTITHLLDEVHVGGEAVDAMEAYKGERVSKATASVLKHVVDEFKSHFGNKDTRDVTFSVSGLYKLIATSYAFMVPQQLTAFTSQIRGITSGGDIEYDQQSRNKKGPAISPGAAYEVMGAEWLGSQTMIKYLQSQRSRTT